MHSNTLKTIGGFCRAFIERRTRRAPRASSLTDIYNYLDIDGLYATSGQPSEAQFGLIKNAGYEAVINLAPTSILENSVVNERQVLSDLGLRYIHLPVDFKAPRTADFNAFVAELEALGDTKVWVHCAANMRVSAFTYRYRRAVLGVDEATAKADLERIWEPLGVWKKFVRKADATTPPAEPAAE